MWSVRNNNLQCVKTLLDFKASLDLQDTDGDSALHVACGQGHAAIVRLLLDCGANMLLCNKGGKCCLEIAAKTGSSDVAMTIVKHKRLVATDVITQFRHGINRVGTKLAVNIILTHNEHDLQKFHQNAKVRIDQIMDTYAMSTAVK